MAISDWKLGTTTLPTTTIVSAKTQYAGRKLHGVPYAGQLGSDVLARFRTVTLDFAGKRLILGGLGGQAPSGGKTLAVKIIRIGANVVVAVRATIHGKLFAYIIDTGSPSRQSTRAQPSSSASRPPASR